MMGMTILKPPPPYEQAAAAEKRLTAAAEAFHAALLVPLTDPETGKEMLPRTPLADVLRLNEIAIRRAHPRSWERHLEKFTAAEKELYDAILEATRPADGEGVSSYPRVPLRKRAQLAGLTVYAIERIVAAGGRPS
ncbi:hypothetical protein GCM10010466_39460 [Planomonospora alba]|uniref:Uncharacterized protein n=2 Tax=Planomonospora alba TaxID=161354 RepID=A0ABP6NDJ7_9ACTN